MRNVALVLLVLFIAVPVRSETIYYCVKAGRKVVTDQPCINQGAVEQKHVEGLDLPPLTTTQGLTSGEVQRSQNIDARLHQEKVVDDAQRALNLAEQQREEARNKRICRDLGKYKDDIIAQQRIRNSDWWNEEHRRVNDEIYRRKCETM